MEYIMWPRILIMCVIPILVTSITISPNGNSPALKMVGGMKIDVQNEFVTSRPKLGQKTSTIKKNIDENKATNINSTKLAINERYRRLIPYMTFYYANDLLPPTTEAYNAKSVEVEKAQIVEAGTIEEQNHRKPKLIHPHHRQHNIPRYQGNRLTHFNIASANPTKIFYSKEGYPIILQNAPKVSPNYNPVLIDHNSQESLNDYRRFVTKETKNPNAYRPPKKPYVYHNAEDINVQLYPEREEIKYQLVPYEQTPPVRNIPLEFDNAPKKVFNVPETIPIESVYVKPRPRPQYHYDGVVAPQAKIKKPPVTISESYYEKQSNVPVLTQPVIETGFKPIIKVAHETTEPPVYTSPTISTPQQYTIEKTQETVIDSVPVTPSSNAQPEYYHYITDQPTHVPPVETSNAITIADLLNSLQLNKSIPKPITKENVGSSIRILLQALNALKGRLQEHEVDAPVLSSPAPFVAPKTVITTERPIIAQTKAPIHEETDLNEESYLAEVETPSQHLDDYTSGNSQRFPLPITSDEEGGTPGRPGIDYPTLTVIPHTKFDCKTQRYKGFFADPETRCQVWHYCDLNGGQASFLCPNGTIFSQAGLTCDWWFNVKCSSTTQLYVLNESLYKYILPHSPKFPEDYSGPLVDKYLTLKFKEMEEEFKKNKNKNKQSDSAEKNDSTEDEESSKEEKEVKNTQTTDEKDDAIDPTDKVSESSVIVATSGASGNVERLEE